MFKKKQGDFEFNSKYSLEERTMEAIKVMKKYPDRVPIICEIYSKSALPDLDRTKYLVPYNITVGQFAFTVRKRLKLQPEKAIFLIIGEMFPSTSSLIGDLYDKYKDEDKFLKILIKEENTFG
jgi:GABA(A) receptor-associated protein